MPELTPPKNVKLILSDDKYQLVNKAIKLSDIAVKDYYMQVIFPTFMSWYRTLEDPMAWELVPLYKETNRSKKIYLYWTTDEHYDEVKALSEKHRMHFNTFVFNTLLIWIQNDLLPKNHKEEEEEAIFTTGVSTFASTTKNYRLECDRELYERCEHHMSNYSGTKSEFFTEASMFWALRRMQSSQGWRYKQPPVDELERFIDFTHSHAQYESSKWWAEHDGVKIVHLLYNILVDFFDELDRREGVLHREKTLLR